jgi:hypothetical protein
MRTKRYTVSLSERELAMLRALAEHAGVDQSDVVRMEIRRLYAARIAAQAAAST